MNEFLALFTRTSKLLRAAADDAMRIHGVRVGQNIVLEALWQEDGLTPRQLALRLHMATPTVVNTAKRMEAAGLVRRQPDTEDRRLVRIFLTDTARAIRAAIEEERDQLERRATKSLTDIERWHLFTAMNKIIEELDGRGAPAE
jgi:DNA-binding MarR family transcriptional regulator